LLLNIANISCIADTNHSGPQTRHHLASILADHYKTEDIGFSMGLGEP
jgi:hypothetical protein